MWQVQPGPAGLGLNGAISLLVVSSVAYAYSEVLHNATLSQAGRPDAQPQISGIGLALGNGGGLLLMVFMLLAFFLPADGIKTPLSPDAPLFGLNPERHEIERFSGPLTAMWMVVFVIPFFAFMPGREVGGRQAERPPITRSYFKQLWKDHPDAVTFLFGRMLYADGVSVLLALSGVYVVTFLGWSGAELPLYALCASVFAGLGGLLGGRLDDWLGARRALILELSIVLLALLGQLSITREALFFGLVPVADSFWDAPVFNTASDLAYLGFTCVSACAVVAAISSSRVMMVSLSPAPRMGEFFGLYAVVGTVTVWIGPLLVEFVTRWTGSQRLGMASASLLVLAGLVVLLRVKGEGRPGSDHAAKPTAVNS